MAAPQTVSKSTKLVVALLLFVVSFAAFRWIYFPHTAEGQRRARIEAARVHARMVVAPLLAKDKRFADVRATEWWKDEGYFWVRGGVDNEADLRDLKQLIIATHPPAPIAWEVEVAAPATNSNPKNP